jgi:site-specific DNA recombinase
MSTRWAFYTRISDGDQVYGYSLEAQRADSEQFVRARGGEIVATYEDHQSGRKAERRSAFQHMVDDAHAGAFDAVVVHKFDRFARNRKDSVVYKAVLKKIGIHVYSVLEPTDPESPTSILFEGMLEVFAEYFSANLAQEVRKGLGRRALAGLHSGSPAYGYTTEHGHLRATDDLVSVKLALEAYLSGTATDMDIVRLLNSRGPSMTKADGSLGRFTRDAVRYILTNPIYAGYVRYNGTLIKGDHDPVITLEQHHTILRLRKRFYRGPRHNRRSQRDYPFSKIARCGRCGGTMGASYAETRGYGRTTYRCLDRARGKSVCDQPAVRTQVVEEAADSALHRMRVPMALLERARALTDPVVERERVAATRTGLQERLRRARFLFLNDGLTEGEWEQERTRVDHELRQLPEASLIERPLPTVVDPRWMDIGTLWERASPAEQKLLARLLLDAIVIDSQTVHIVALTPLGHSLTDPP